jgi:hypothetical protein
MSIADLCTHIRSSETGGSSSRIVRVIWLKEQSGVKHEFLLMNVVADPIEDDCDALPPHSPSSVAATIGSGIETFGSSKRGEPKVTWLRLDRAARKGYRGLMTLRSFSSIFPANDTVSCYRRYLVLYSQPIAHFCILSS